MKLLTKFVEIIFDYVPARFNEVTRESIGAWSSISRHFFDNIIDFLFGERNSKQVQVLCAFDDIRKVKFHRVATRGAQPVLVSMVNKSLFSSMIFHSCVIIKAKTGYIISSIPFRSKGFKKFRVLISKLNPSNCASFFRYCC